MSGSVSHAGPSIPTDSRVVLMRPSDGCISTANVMPTATVLTRTGKKMSERSDVPEPDAATSAASPASSPMTTLRPLVTTA